MKKISVIVPVYNAEKYLQDWVESIIQQSYQNIEIILINDGSTDNSYAVMQRLQEKDKRIRIFSRENKGTLYTRIEGAKLASGEYIMYVDSDDYIDNVMIEKLLQQVGEADIIRCGYIVENLTRHTKKQGEEYFKQKTILKRENFQKLYELYLTTYQYSSICIQLIKTEIFKQIHFENIKSINMCEDLYLNLQAVTKAKEIIFLPEPYYHYMIRENSTCTTLSIEKIQKRMIDGTYVYMQLYDYIKKWNIDNAQNQSIIANRILKELVVQAKPLFYISCSKKQIVNVLQKVVQSTDFNQVKKLANKNQLDFFEKIVYEEKWTKFYHWGKILIEPKYRLKAIIKKIIYKE